MNILLLKKPVSIFMAGTLMAMIVGCVVGGGYGYGGAGYYEPVGVEYGGWGSGYQVAPYRDGDHRWAGQAASYAYRPASGRSVPSIASHSRSSGGSHGGGLRR